MIKLTEYNLFDHWLGEDELAALAYSLWPWGMPLNTRVRPKPVYPISALYIGRCSLSHPEPSG